MEVFVAWQDVRFREELTGKLKTPLTKTARGSTDRATHCEKSLAITLISSHGPDPSEIGPFLLRSYDF